jgi:hypothetical protein
MCDLPYVNVTTNDTMKATATAKKKPTHLLAGIAIKPIKPAGPSDDDITWNNPITKAAIPDEPNAIKNGNLYFKLTPNIAGSVIPSIAEAPADEDNARTFSFPLLKN